MLKISQINLVQGPPPPLKLDTPKKNQKHFDNHITTTVSPIHFSPTMTPGKVHNIN